MERELNYKDSNKIPEIIQNKLFDLKIDPNQHSKNLKVSDRELLNSYKGTKKISKTLFTSSKA